MVWAVLLPLQELFLHIMQEDYAVFLVFKANFES